MKVYNKTALVVLLLLSTMVSVTTAGIPFKKKEFTKKIEKTFDISADGKVDLSNRYGQVTVKTWEQNKVEINVLIKVNSRDEDDADETFDRIDIEFSNSANFVSAATHIESKSYSGGGWLNWFGGGSYSSDDYSIHYTVQMPSSNDLVVANKYGNATIEDIEGDADMTIKYGNIDMGNIGGDFTLNLGYGNATLGNSGNADVTIKYSNFKAKNLKNLRIESKYSKMKIEGADDVRSQTKYDNREIRLEGRYTDFKMGVTGDFQLDARSSYGSIRYPDNTEIQIDKEKSHDHEVEGYRGSKNGGMIKARMEYGGLKVY